MQRDDRTRAAMRLSHGLILGRIWTSMRHFVLGVCALSLGTMALTGHVFEAIVIVVSLYLVSKAVEYGTTRLMRRPR